MKIWSLVVLLIVCILQGLAQAAVITHLPGHERVIALTFDACETKTPSYFDRSILDYLLAQHLPCTFFISGKFARRNEAELKLLAKNPQVEIENHTLNHYQHMERLPPSQVVREVQDNETLLTSITGHAPRFFRFPAGNYDQKTLGLVEGLGYRVVHWSFASGDPDKHVTPEHLTSWVLAKARPGDILIFHINGRGYSTGKALPGIVDALRHRGFRFVRLDEVLQPSPALKTPPTPAEAPSMSPNGTPVP